MAQDHSRTFEPDVYWSTRDYKTSARLHLQHWLFQKTLKFVLHPTILESVLRLPEPRVADIACGNGAWITELHDILPDEKPVEIDGFDFNPVNFPSQAFMPKGVRFHVLDVLGQVPQELHGKYDIVHIRAFCSVVVNNDTEPILSNMLKLLKPGGWLQWDEMKTDEIIAQAPDSATSKATCDSMLKIIEEGGKARGTVFGWLNEIEPHFANRGFNNIEVGLYDQRPEDYKAWTEDHLLVWEDITPNLPSKETAPDAPLTREMWRSLLQQAVQETNRGVVIHTQRVVVGIGQKPEIV